MAKTNGSGNTPNKITLTLREAYTLANGFSQCPPLYSGKAQYTLSYIVKQCQQQMRAFEKDRVKKQAEIPKPQMPDPTNPQPQQTPEYHEGVQKYNAWLEEQMDAISFTIERAPLKLADVLGPKPESEPKIPGAVWNGLIAVVVEE